MTIAESGQSQAKMAAKKRTLFEQRQILAYRRKFHCAKVLLLSLKYCMIRVRNNSNHGDDGREPETSRRAVESRVLEKQMIRGWAIGAKYEDSEQADACMRELWVESHQQGYMVPSVSREKLLPVYTRVPLAVCSITFPHACSSMALRASAP